MRKELAEQLGENAGKIASKRYRYIVEEFGDEAAEVFLDTMRRTGDLKEANKAVNHLERQQRQQTLLRILQKQ
ncbi:MAG: hypothetical protein CM15mV36_1720 [Caudoviricetes sp.]|nr:MAG: hypothetical protein CM15mV36_1720 [Caudoviricetes sp.]